MPPTNSTSSSNANTECPITPLRRTSGREWGLLKCSSVESASHGGRSWFRIRAAVTCEIQAPGDATESARAAASSSKLQAVGRYSSRLTWATSALRSLLGGTPDAFADSKVKGADTRLSGRSVRGCMRHCCSKRTGPAEVIHRRANRPTALEEASVLTRRKVRKRPRPKRRKVRKRPRLKRRKVRTGLQGVYYFGPATVPAEDAATDRSTLRFAPGRLRPWPPPCLREKKMTATLRTTSPAT